MIIFLVTLQALLLILQLYCLGYCVKNSINPVDYCYGYAIWGCIPSVLITALVHFIGG